jgi:hypothetical protein
MLPKNWGLDLHMLARRGGEGGWKWKGAEAQRSLLGGLSTVY